MKQSNTEIDRKLSSPQQQSMANLVRDLPEETMSLSWRSSLNEKILLEASRKQKKRFVLRFVRPVAGLATASVFVFCFFALKQGDLDSASSPKRAGLEASLVSFHRENSTSFDVTGVGLSLPEALNDHTVVKESSSEWTESDIEGL